MEAGHTILFTRYTLRSASISIIPEFIEKLELLNISDLFHITKDDITNKITGSKILFRGIKTSSGDQTASLKSLQGVTTWVLDEAEELTEEAVFDKIDLSVRHQDLQNRIILILNPTTKEHWVYDRFFLRAGVQGGFNGSKGETTYIHTTYLDNIKNLSKSFLNSVEQMKLKRPKKYEHQILGGWLDVAEGVVFDNWTLGNFDNSLALIYGQDFGYSTDPSTLVKIGIDQKKQKIYLQECLYKTGLNTNQIAKENLRYAANNLIVADSAEPRLIDELKVKGCNIKGVKKGAGSILEGIKLMQDYDLIIDPNSTNLIKELNNYTWVSNKTKPIDAYNHILDAARYGITHALADVNAGKYFVY
jgi:phage terminase large subunit